MYNPMENVFLLYIKKKILKSLPNFGARHTIDGQDLKGGGGGHHAPSLSSIQNSTVFLGLRDIGPTGHCNDGTRGQYNKIMKMSGY